MKDEVFERGERIASIFKLVDACHRCGLTFQLASRKSVNRRLRRYLNEGCRVLERFSFELSSEVRRLDDEAAAADRTTSPVPTDISSRGCDAALGDLLQDYEVTMQNAIPAHARAMMNRQAQVLKQIAAAYHTL